MKNVFLLAICLTFVGLVSCSDDEELVPKVDTANEYEAKLKARANDSEADAQIWEWYKKYGSAFVYDFSDEEFHWQWASTLTDTYEQFDMTDPMDRAKLDDFVAKIKEGFMDNFADNRLKTALPFRIFLCKRLNPNSSTFSNKDTVAVSNLQDAIIVGYEGKGGVYSTSTIGNGMSGTFGLFFYSKLKTPPIEFLESRTEVNFGLVTTPKDERIADEFDTTPKLSNNTNDLLFKEHRANVCGYIHAYLPTRVQLPTEAQDFADYFAFLTCNSSATIRMFTQNYWRIAWRATIYMKYWREYLDEDLMETHNAKFPDDKLTDRDFRY